MYSCVQLFWIKLKKNNTQRPTPKSKYGHWKGIFSAEMSSFRAEKVIFLAEEGTFSAHTPSLRIPALRYLLGWHIFIFWLRG
jgi:hypothetical protein